MKYLQQFVTTNLNVGGGIDDSQTTGIVLQSLNNIDATKPSVACITWADPLNTSVAEWVTYESVNSTTNELQGVTRGAEGYSAKAHLNQAVIAFPLSKAHVNELNDAVTTITSGTQTFTGAKTFNSLKVDDNGIDLEQIDTPSNPDSGRNKIYFKDDNKAYTLDSEGNEVQIGSGGGTLVETFIIPGTLATGTDMAKTFVLPFDCKLQSATPYVKTAGTTNATTFDVNLNGSTIATTKLSIASGATSGSNQALDDPTTTRSAGSLITIDIDSVSTTAPSEAYIQLFYERA